MPSARKSPASSNESTMKFVKIGVAIALFAAAGAAYFFLNKRPLTPDEPAAGATPTGDGAKPAEAPRPMVELPKLPDDAPRGGPRANPEYKPDK
jgi:hypothetical protein